MTDFTYAVGDFGDYLEAQLQNEHGQPYNLTGLTVTLQFCTADGTQVWLHPVIVITAATGIVRYTWAAGELNAPGAFLLRFIATQAGVLHATFPRPGFLTLSVTS